MSTPVETLSEKRTVPREAVRQVVFRIRSLYGISEPAPIPAGTAGTVEPGQVCITLDPHIDPSCNIGLLDYETGKLTVRYGIQMFVPGLYKLITTEIKDPSLLYPMRGVVTTTSALIMGQSGWETSGTLEFVPGGIWAGAQARLESQTSGGPQALQILAEGRSLHAAHASRLFIQWPDYLGGGESTLNLEGSLLLDALLAIG